MSLTHSFLAFIAFVLLTSCSLYKSEDRKDFESETSGFLVQNLSIQHCSGQSVRSRAQSARLVSVLSSATSEETTFLWEHKIDSVSVFETDNLQGTYCRYANN